MIVGAAFIWSILPLIALEAVALIAWRRRTGHGISPAPLLANLAAGACLIAAVGAGMAGSAAVWPLVTLAGAAHVLDLWTRWR